MYFVGTLKPFEEPRGHVMEILNEVFIVLVQYHMFLFTQMVSEAETRAMMGQSCVGFTCAVILLNMSVMMVTSIKAIILRVRRCCLRRKAKKLLKKRKKAYQEKLKSRRNPGEERKQQIPAKTVANTLVSIGPA